MQTIAQRKEMLEALVQGIRNPWIANGRELLRIRSAICGALTRKQFLEWSWKQHQFWSRCQDPGRTFRFDFESVASVTKNRKALELAAEGLALVELCEKTA